MSRYHASFDNRIRVAEVRRPYNALLDHNCNEYFRSPSVLGVLKKTGVLAKLASSPYEPMSMAEYRRAQDIRSRASSPTEVQRRRTEYSAKSVIKRPPGGIFHCQQPFGGHAPRHAASHTSDAYDSTYNIRTRQQAYGKHARSSTPTSVNAGRNSPVMVSPSTQKNNYSTASGNSEIPRRRARTERETVEDMVPLSIASTQGSPFRDERLMVSRVD